MNKHKPSSNFVVCKEGNEYLLTSYALENFNEQEIQECINDYRTKVEHE